MRIVLGRRELRLEQSRNVKTVRGGFDGADLTLRAARDHRKPSFHGGPFEFRINLEVAEEFFGDGIFVLAVERLQVRARAETNLRNRARKFGGVAFAVGNGAGDRINEDVLRSGIVFGGVGVFDVEDVARELDEGILESATGAEERPVAAARELDAFEHSVETFVWAARRGPKAVEAFELLFCLWRSKRGCRQPLAFHFYVELVGRVLQRIVDGVMRAEIGIEITQNSDADGVAHGLIVLEGTWRSARVGWRTG